MYNVLDIEIIFDCTISDLKKRAINVDKTDLIHFHHVDSEY